MRAAAPMVFVVDDDPSVRMGLTRLLTAAGHHVEAFASAQDFLAREQPAGPCCLLLDVRMPGLNGLALQAVLAAGGRRMSHVAVGTEPGALLAHRPQYTRLERAHNLGLKIFKLSDRHVSSPSGGA